MPAVYVVLYYKWVRFCTDASNSLCFGKETDLISRDLKDLKEPRRSSDSGKKSMVRKRVILWYGFIALQVVIIKSTFRNDKILS